jgi:hypothetical protein
MSISSRKSKVGAAAVWSVVGLNALVAWYPFALDLPQRLDNSAARLPAGGWSVDSQSRIVGHASDRIATALHADSFKLTVVAYTLHRNQTGPARLISVARSPFEPGFMLGIDGSEAVVYMPCGAAESHLDAEWRVPLAARKDGAVRMTLLYKAQPARLAIQTDDEGIQELPNHCPSEQSPRPPHATRPWALGNVYSGHRPFVGRIVLLELADDAGTVDLLHQIRWDVPGKFWLWPERLYQHTDNPKDQALSAAWHFGGFAAMGYLLSGIGQARALGMASLTAIALNAGKVLVAGRHPSIVDLLVNVVGAAAGLYAGRRRLARPLAG